MGAYSSWLARNGGVWKGDPNPAAPASMAPPASPQPSANPGMNSPMSIGGLMLHPGMFGPMFGGNPLALMTMLRGLGVFDGMPGMPSSSQPPQPTAPPPPGQGMSIGEMMGAMPGGGSQATPAVDPNALTSQKFLSYLKSNGIAGMSGLDVNRNLPGGSADARDRPWNDYAATNPSISDITQKFFPKTQWTLGGPVSYSQDNINNILKQATAWQAPG